MSNEQKQVKELMQRVIDADQALINKSFELVKFKVDVNISLNEVRNLVCAIREDIAEIEGTGKISHDVVKSFWKHMTELEEVLTGIRADYL